MFLSSLFILFFTHVLGVWYLVSAERVPRWFFGVSDLLAPRHATLPGGVGRGVNFIARPTSFVDAWVWLAVGGISMTNLRNRSRIWGGEVIELLAWGLLRVPHLRFQGLDLAFLGPR